MPDRLSLAQISQNHVHCGGQILTGRIRRPLRTTDAQDVYKNDCRELVDNQVELHGAQGFVGKNLSYFPAHRRENLSQEISLFLTEVLWISDKDANQRQISIDERYLRFGAFQ